MNEISLLSITAEELKNIVKEAIREEINNFPTEEPEKFLSVEEASIYLKTTKSTIYKMTMEKKIPFYKPTGKRVFFKKSELDEWITRSRSKSMHEIEQEATNYILKNRR